MAVPDRLGYWAALIRCCLTRERFRVPAIDESHVPTPQEQNLAEQYATGILQRTESELLREAAAQRSNPSMTIYQRDREIPYPQMIPNMIGIWLRPS